MNILLWKREERKCSKTKACLEPHCTVRGTVLLRKARKDKVPM